MILRFNSLEQSRRNPEFHARACTRCTWAHVCTIARFARPSLLTDGSVYKTLRNERALAIWKQLGAHPLTFSRMVRRYIGGRSGTQYKQHGGLIRSACNNNIANAYGVFIGCMQCWRLFGRARNTLEIRRQCRGRNDWMLVMTRMSLDHRTHVMGSIPVDDSRVMGSKKYSCYGEESKFLTISARPNCDSQQNDSCHGIRRWFTRHRIAEGFVSWDQTMTNMSSWSLVNHHVMTHTP